MNRMRIAQALLRGAKKTANAGAAGMAREAAVGGAIGNALETEGRILGYKKWTSRLLRHPGWTGSIAAKRSLRGVKGHPIATGIAAATIGQSVYQDVREHKMAHDIRRIRAKIGA